MTAGRTDVEIMVQTEPISEFPFHFVCHRCVPGFHGQPATSRLAAYLDATMHFESAHPEARITEPDWVSSDLDEGG